MPFDPDQPRDEKGQWTDTGASSALKNAASDKKRNVVYDPVTGERYMNDEEQKVFDDLKKPNPMQAAASDYDKIKNMKVEEAIADVSKEFNDYGSLLGVQGRDEEEKETLHNFRRELMENLDVRLNRAGLNVYQKMDIVEDMIRYQPFESVAMYDKDGNLGLFKDGDEGKVSVGGRGSQNFEGGTMTHNHPRDQSFSNGDLNTTVTLGLKEMRAASAGHDFIFRPNYKLGYDMEGSVALNKGLMEKSIYDEINDTRDRIISGDMDQVEANRFFQHRIMQRFAKETGGVYKVEAKDVTGLSGKVQNSEVLLSNDKYDYLGEEAVNEIRKERRIAMADDVNIAMRKLRKQIKKYY